MIGFEGKTIKSERLTFRLLEEQDKKYLFPILGEEETAKPSGFFPMSDVEELEDFWQGLVKHNTAIAILLDGKCIGYFHVNRYIPDGVYREKTNCGIGYLIGRDYLRKGYGSETLKTLCDYLLTRFDNVWGDSFSENIASEKTLLKCGFKYVEDYKMVFDELGGEEKTIRSHVLSKKKEA